MARRSILSLVALIVAAAAGLTAQIDVSQIGPKVGAKAPALQLADQQGRVQTIASLAGPKGTMLVFFRSADW